MSKKIEYRGVITAIRSGILQVEVRDATPCESCSAQSSCCMSGSREKRVEIPFTSGDYRLGDEVTIVGKASMEFKAVFIAFVLPLILILVTLLIGSSMGADERRAALISFVGLVIYFLGIFLLRDRIKGTFTFGIGDGDLKNLDSVGSSEKIV